LKTKRYATLAFRNRASAFQVTCLSQIRSSHFAHFLASH
jgi:hypothetical protein